jgi:hypothetical protein
MKKVKAVGFVCGMVFACFAFWLFVQLTVVPRRDTRCLRFDEHHTREMGIRLFDNSIKLRDFLLTFEHMNWEDGCVLENTGRSIGLLTMLPLMAAKNVFLDFYIVIALLGVVFFHWVFIRSCLKKQKIQ